jgi:hypothetical protein
MLEWVQMLLIIGLVGQYGCGETNDRGSRLLEFATSHNLTLANTLFLHKLSRISTWNAPNRSTHHQINYILISNKFKSSINKVRTRTFPGADMGNDHDTVLMTLKLKIKVNYKRSKHSQMRFNLEKLKDRNCRNVSSYCWREICCFKLTRRRH